MTPRIEEKVSRFQVVKLEERIAPTGFGCGGLINLDVDVKVDLDISLGKGGGCYQPCPPPPCHPVCRW